MGKSLVLAEKPSVGKELARVLGCNQHGQGCYIGSKYIVTWALGHLVTLADPEYYGDQYKSWKLETLPMIPKKMELVVIKETSKQFGIVKALMKQADVTELIIATDAGREGELVARWIIQKVGFNKPLKRLWISSQTDSAIKDGFSRLQDGRNYNNLFASAECRAEADWLVGFNVTRALTCKHNVQLSAGRVQTPTLALIVQREEEIRRFIPKDYWLIQAKLNGYFATWRDAKTNQARIFDEKLAQSIVQKVKSADFVVSIIKKDAKREYPPLLYDLTELQRDANRMFGFSAKATLGHMQKLYEQHKLLTYPRTDSRYITADIVPTLGERLKCISVGAYADFTKEIIRNRSPIASSFVNNAKVSDHHAIIPTDQHVDLSQLTSDEKRIYDLVVKRFIAAFYGNFLYEQTTVVFSANGELFDVKGKTVQAKGWKAIYDKNNDHSIDEEERDQELPELKKGEVVKAASVQLKNGKTKPPARYTEATLLSAMEHPGRFIEDTVMREVMDKTSGLGTPATRAEIIERLLGAFYIERRGNDLFPTSKGIQLIDLVPLDLKQPELTAKWEQQLTAISKGTANKPKFIEDIRLYADTLVKKVISNTAQYRHDNATKTRCPNCDKFLLEVAGKKGKMLVCQDRECGYKKSLSFLSNARCPTCHKQLEVFGEDEKKIYTCHCGFREKFDKFNQKLQENRDNMSKKELQDYLQKQKSETPSNNSMKSAFADLLKDIKEEE